MSILPGICNLEKYEPHRGTKVSKVTAKNMTTNNMVFFLGGADCEMVAIRQILEAEGIAFCDKGLGWGAAVSAYSEEIAAVVSEGKVPVLVELAADIELPAGSIEVDHHNANANRPASILQVLSLIDKEPTRMQQLIAANDSAYIPGMLALGASADEIAAVRLLDRQAQGITSEQEAEAERALAAAEVNNGVIIVKMAHSKTATIADRLFDPNKEQRLLILSGDGESNFFGNGNLCRALQGEDTGKKTPEGYAIYSHFGGWIGGDLDGKGGFWGGYADQKEIRNYVVNFFA